MPGKRGHLVAGSIDESLDVRGTHLSVTIGQDHGGKGARTLRTIQRYTQSHTEETTEISYVSDTISISTVRSSRALCRQQTPKLRPFDLFTPDRDHHLRITVHSVHLCSTLQFKPYSTQNLRTRKSPAVMSKFFHFEGKCRGSRVVSGLASEAASMRFADYICGMLLAVAQKVSALVGPATRRSPGRHSHTSTFGRGLMVAGARKIDAEAEAMVVATKLARRPRRARGKKGRAA